MPRLPIPGSDEGIWGDILNEYLRVGHAADGTHETIPIAQGGTGATTAADARTNLGVASSSDLTTHGNDTTSVHGIADTSLLETTTGAQTKVDNHASDTTSVHGIADTSVLETTSGAQTKVDAHSTDTTNVHGIADTSVLETTTGAQAKADAAETDANTYTDTQVSAHTSDTTAAHAATAVSFTPSGTISATNVQDAILEVATESGASVTLSDQNPADLATTAAPGTGGEVSRHDHVHAYDGLATDAELTTHASTTTGIHGVGASTIESTAGSQAKVDTHNADTTSVHGIADTSTLETTTGSQNKVDTHVNDTTSAHAASSIAFTPTGTVAASDVQAAIAEVASEAASSGSLAAHEADTTNIHGIADTSVLETTTGSQAKVDTHAALTATHGATGALVGTTNTQTLTNKTLTSPVINTPTGIVKGDVGLGNVDNTSDANKPVSTAQQTALDAKLNLAGGTMTGALTLAADPTVALHAATKQYVDAGADSTGITWTSRTSAADNEWRSVTYGNGLFVAVAQSGTGNRVMTSPDGINWAIRTSAADNGWNSVTYGNGLFVAVADSGTGNRVMTSPDGINWAIRTSAADNGWNSVTYGNGLFVATAITGTGNRVMTSPDGINWTIRTSAADNSWRSIIYGTGLFVAVSYTGTGNRVMTSPDGINWTIRTSAADNLWYSVTYGNGLFVATAITGTGNRVMTSPDGINWTIRTSAADNSWRSIIYGTGLFVAVSYTGTGNRVMTSPDGINWTIRTSAADNLWYSVTYGNGLFVAVSYTGTGNRVMTSGKQQEIETAHNNIYQGGLTSTGAISAADGTATAPTYTFSSDADTGIYRKGANDLGFAAGGSLQANMTGGQLILGGATPQSTAKIVSRAGGNDIEFGHSNTAGYGSTIGSQAGSGNPFFAFNAEAGTTGNTYRTRGIKGSVLMPDLLGGVAFATADNASADNQTLTTRATLSAGGAWRVSDGSAAIPSLSFINDTSMGIYRDGTDLGITTAGVRRVAFGNTRLIPFTDNAIQLGQSGSRWVDVWAVNGTIQTSDATTKASIAVVDQAAALQRIKQVVDGGGVISFRWPDGTRTHLGFDAGKVGEVHGEASAAFINPAVEAAARVNPHDKAKEPEDWQRFEDETAAILASPKGMRYNEMIPDLYAALAAALERIEALEERVKDLESQN